MKTNLFIIAAISGFVATGAMAQTTTFNNQSSADDAVTKIEDSIADAAEREVSFGNDGREVGSYGSVSLRATASKIDGVEASDMNVGLRYGTFDGVNGVDVSAAYTFGTDATGATSTNKLQAGADYRRDFNDTLFAYAKGNVILNQIATGNSTTQDVFVGAGLGYRIFNSADTQWSVQAGPGYRMKKSGNGTEVNQAAASVSSNIYKSLTDTSYVTNDTDVIYSEVGTIVENELALNVTLTDTLSLRTSYITNFDDSTDATFGDGDNTLGVSVVYNFN